MSTILIRKMEISILSRRVLSEYTSHTPWLFLEKDPPPFLDEVSGVYLSIFFSYGDDRKSAYGSAPSSYASVPPGKLYSLYCLMHQWDFNSWYVSINSSNTSTDISQNLFNLPHRCPKLCRAPGRFVNTNLSFIIVITWKSMKSCVRLRNKIDPFKTKQKVTGGQRSDLGHFFRSQKMRKSSVKLSTD